MSRKPIQDIRTVNALFPAAELEAKRMGVKTPGAEHLVLAAVELPEDSARRAFERAGVDPGAFRVAIVRLRDDDVRASAGGAGGDPDEKTPDPAPSLMPTRTSPSASTVFKRVVELVRKEKSPLYGAYIVMVAADDSYGTTARVLRSMGIDPTALAAAARAEIDAAAG